MKFTRLISPVVVMFLACCFAFASQHGVPVVGAQVFIEPGQSRQDVDKWFEQLRDAGMQVCRIRLHESHINNDGKWDFTLYDYAFDSAQRHGIRVFATLFPNDSKKSVGGEKFPESDRHFAEVGRYVDKTVSHYRNHPALMAWVIQNEPGTGGVIPENEFTDKAYAKWLKTRVAPSSGFITNSYDREQFLLEYESWYLQWLSERIRKIDTAHDLHVNNHQIFCNVAEYDFVKWRGFLNSLGASAHPSWHYGYFSRNQYALAMAANCNIIRSGAGELPYWVTELQAGNNLYSGTVPICPTGDEITQWLWTSASNGAEGIIFWSLNPRSATGEPGEWALLSLDNTPSERYLAAKEFVETLNANASLFEGADKFETPVTVLYNRESLWAEKKMQHVGVRQDEGRSPGAVMKEALGLYQACAENGIIPSFSELREFDWDKADYTGQLLIIANQIAIPDEFVEKIGNFVSSGGRLIVTGLTGFWGTLNVCHACNDFLFKDIFGASFKEVKYVGDEFSIKMQAPDISLPSHMWKSTVNTGTAATTASECGETLCCRNSYGKGEVIWIPSLVGLGKRRNNDMNLSYLLMAHTATLDIPLRFACPCSDVLMNTMQNGETYITTIINKNSDARLIPLQVRGSRNAEVIFASKGGNVLPGGIVNILPEETLVIKWK